MKWVRAGHDPAIFYDPGADAFEELGGKGVALGVEETWIYEENEKSDLVDGQIILIDEAAGIVHIDLGSDDHIYRGLTFSIYDKASGVSADDEPKAEIEVFAITEKTAAARIIR